MLLMMTPTDKNNIQHNPKSANAPIPPLLNPMEFPGLVDRKVAEVAFMLLRRPSFDPEASWALYRDGNQWFVRRIICAFGNGPLAAKLEPNTYGAETAIPNVRAESLLADLRQISIGFVPNAGGGIVLDGCRYEVRCDNTTMSLNLEWWCEAPSEWSELRDWYANAVTVLQAHLPEPTVPIQVVHPWCE